MPPPETPPLREQDLAGKIAVVTGASRGIGRAIALNLASRGCSVLATCSGPQSLHHIDSLARTVSEVFSRSSVGPPKISGIAADITCANCPGNIVSALEADFGGHIDILVNNAVHASRTMIGEMESTKVQEDIFANVQTPIMLLDELVKRKMFRPDSRIVNISSDVSRLPKYPGMSVYIAVKAALEGLSRAWAVELGANPKLDFMKGTTANAVTVGLTASGMYDNLPAESKKLVEDSFLPGQLLGHDVASCEDIADVVGFLCSRESRWVTGSVVAANGGTVHVT